MGKKMKILSIILTAMVLTSCNVRVRLAYEIDAESSIQKQEPEKIQA